MIQLWRHNKWHFWSKAAKEEKGNRDCLQCKGTGIEERPYSIIGKTVMLPYLCPRCEGTGKVKCVDWLFSIRRRRRNDKDV